MPFYWQRSQQGFTVSRLTRVQADTDQFVYRYWYIYGLSIPDDGKRSFRDDYVELSNGRIGRHYIFCSTSSSVDIAVEQAECLRSVSLPYLGALLLPYWCVQLPS